MGSKLEMFRLGPIDFEPLERSHLASLPPITPRFSLPSLEDGNASDRLLAGLKGGRPGRPLNDERITGKGKEKERIQLQQEPQAVEERLDEGDFWLNVVDSEPGPSKPRLNKPKVWDDLRDPLAIEDPIFLSEAPVFTFDALISTNEPRLDLPHLKSSPVRSPRSSAEVLKLVMQATLGNVITGGIKWNPKEYRFTWATEAGRAVGLDGTTTSSAISGFLEISTCLRRLELTVDSLTPRPMTPTHHSLLHGLSTCLTYIKQRLTSSIEGCEEEKAAWNKACSGLRDVRALLHVLSDIIQWLLDQAKPVPLPSRATSLLTHLHAHLLARISISSQAQTHTEPVLALAYLLKTSSQPLLALLHQWVGLSDTSPSDEVIDPEAQPWSDLGITRHPMPSKEETRWEYTFSSSKMPGFIPKADRRTLFEAGRSLRLLREASGGRHPLCGGGWELAGSWGWGEQEEDNGRLRQHARRVDKEIEQWQRSTRGTLLASSMSKSSSISRLRQPRKYRKSLPAEFMTKKTRESSLPPTSLDEGPDTSREDKRFDPIWSLVHQTPGTHLSHGHATSLWSPTPVSELEELVRWHSHPSRPLLAEDTPTLSQHITAHLLAPLLIHSSLVSTALVSLYLDILNFLDHLDILRAYWLGGDVSFLERVNGALFGKDSAGAGEALGMGQRARTRARLGLGRDDDIDKGKAEEQREWGIGLGIGLSERTKWPPGGAELTYALRTAIVDDEREVLVTVKGDVWEGIEDKVSYAIQDLPEDQRDGRRAKWLNPQDIEALDFLYLAYSPPPTIAVLLPRNLMEKYQSCHNLLLRLGRVETVLRSMFIDNHHSHDLFDEPLKSGVDAKAPRMKTSAREERQRQRSGIFPVGSREEKRLWHLRYRMSHFTTTFSRYVLDIAIGGNWEVLRKRLKKLQKRQSTTSRPGTPSSGMGHEEENEDYFAFEELDLGDDDEEVETQQLHQLHSIHSLVLYHHLIMDRILRSCLLHPSSGHQVAFKILMTLFGICLDFAKTVKEVEKGLLGWMDGAERIEEYWREWVEKETVFLLAVDRLSKRTPAEQNAESGTVDHDLEILLQGEREGDGDEKDGLVLGRQGADLQELVLRIRLS